MLKKLASPSLLDTYTEERLPVIAVMLHKTTELYHQAYVADTSLRRGRELLMLGINYRWSSIVLEERDPNLSDEEKRKASMNEMKARSYGGYEGGLCAGDRAPDAPGLVISHSSDPLKKIGEVTSIFKLYNILKRNLIIFAPLSENNAVNGILTATAKVPASKENVPVFVVTRTDNDYAVGAQQEVAYTLVDRDGHAHDGYFVKEGELTIVIIRPDGYVGAIVHNKSGVGRYFEQIFGC